MSFNARCSSSSKHYRGRHHGTRPHLPSQTTVKAEDAQPNELLSKRNVSGPPVIRSSAPPPHARGRGGPPFAFGRNGPRSPWTDPHIRGGTMNGPPGSQAGPSRPRLPSAKQPERMQQDIRGPTNVDWRPLNAGSYPQRNAIAVDSSRPRAERQLQEDSTGARRDIHLRGNSNLPVIRRQARMEPAVHSSSLPTNHASPWNPIHSLPPPRMPRQQRSFLSLTEGPPYLSSSAPGRILHAEPHKSQQTGQAEGDKSPMSDIGVSRENVPSTSATEGSEHFTKPVKLVQALASASDLLLSDLARASDAATTADPLHSNIPPPRKRRRMSPPVSDTPTRPALPLPRAVPPPVSIVPMSTVTHLLRPFDPPQEAQPAASKIAIKRERSPSPAIGNVAPHLITEGCVRIAPLPPECKNTQPGYQAARKAWTAREAKKVRNRGVQPTRVFVREDGMVIDWKSDVPVMPDTLRPPLVANAHHTLNKKLNVQADSYESYNPMNGPRVLPVAEERLALSPVRSSTPITEPMQRERIPAPGQTIWKRVFPPPRPTSIATIALPNVTQLPNISPFHHSACHSADIDSAPIPQSTVEFIDLTGDGHSDVEIINLTDESSDQVDEQLQPLTTHPRAVVRPSVPSQTVHAVSSAHTRQTKPAAELEHPASAPLSRLHVDTAHIISNATLWHDANADEKQDAALEFLKRYLVEFGLDRASLASAYSRVATFSSQTFPLPEPCSEEFNTSSAHHCGRVDIIAALLDMPEDDAFVAQPTVEWDFVYGKEAGDVLLICYATVDAPSITDDGQRKGKGKAVERISLQSEYVACEHRFILRPKEWDEEDRCTSGLWPLVAVCHQVLIRRLPH
ncbi:hypothetical protein BC628DRAFT_571167 [Trametes gibbosa]|nr:hypothetical protein BC628DRAFT_571167 [Trametes gibbosa]